MNMENGVLFKDIILKIDSLRLDPWINGFVSHFISGNWLILLFRTQNNGSIQVENSKNIHDMFRIEIKDYHSCNTDQHFFSKQIYSNKNHHSSDHLTNTNGARGKENDPFCSLGPPWSLVYWVKQLELRMILSELILSINMIIYQALEKDQE